jgi:hypothetical protein
MQLRIVCQFEASALNASIQIYTPAFYRAGRSCCRQTGPDLKPRVGHTLGYGAAADWARVNQNRHIFDGHQRASGRPAPAYAQVEYLTGANQEHDDNRQNPDRRTWPVPGGGSSRAASRP